jgi:hypothetical protein
MILYLANANEPVPPVMTRIFPLKASVICMLNILLFQPYLAYVIQPQGLDRNINNIYGLQK